MLIKNSFNPRRPTRETISVACTAKKTAIERADPHAVSKELGKLLCAATVSLDFCQRLLTAPNQALDDGYNGESFKLTPQERAVVLSLEASSLADFARQLLNQLGTNPYTQENGLYHDAMYRAVPGGD